MIYVWLSAIVIICFIGIGTALLMLSKLNEKIDNYHAEEMKTISESKKPWGIEL